MLLREHMNFGGIQYITDDYGLECLISTANTATPPLLLPLSLHFLSPILGPIIRIGPNEVHIHDLEYFNQLLSFRPLNKWAMTAQQFGINEALFGTEDYKHYTKKRAAFGDSFSRSNALKLQGLMNGHLEKACGIMRGRYEEGRTIDLA